MQLNFDRNVLAMCARAYSLSAVRYGAVQVFEDSSISHTQFKEDATEKKGESIADFHEK